MKKYTVERAEHFLRLPRAMPGSEQTEILIQRFLMEQRAKLIDALSVCESPREVDFAVAVLACGDKDGAFIELGKRDSCVFAEGRGVRVVAQCCVKLAASDIRIDFAFLSAHHRFAIEIDGQDGHASREQRSKDAARDRELRDLGWAPMRITGTELRRDGALKHAAATFCRLGFEPGVAAPVEFASALTPKAPADAALASDDWNDVVGALRAAQERGRRRMAGGR